MTSAGNSARVFYKENNMIFEECKSYGNKCPCLHCDNLRECEDECDTEKMCKEAREYCERVNGKGEEK